MNLRSCFDELDKLGAISDDQASAALDRLDTLERQKATPGQVLRYGGIGAAGGAAIGGLKNMITKTHGGVRGTIGNAVAGGLSAGVIPVVQKHLDRKSEEGTLKTYLQENEEKTAMTPMPLAAFKQTPKGSAALQSAIQARMPTRAMPNTGGGFTPPKVSPVPLSKPPTTPPVAEGIKPQPGLTSSRAQGKPLGSTNMTTYKPPPSTGQPPQGAVTPPAPQGGGLLRGLAGAASAAITGISQAVQNFKPPPMQPVPTTAAIPDATKLANGDMLQYYIDKKRGDGVDRGSMEYHERHKGKEKDSATDWVTYGPGDFKPAKLAFKLQGHATHGNLGIAIENRKGSVRRGVDADGKPWATKMKLPYGYIKGTKGADGDEVDVYLGPDKSAPNAFVIHQNKEDGSYDEDKVVLGIHHKSEARKIYLDHHTQGEKLLGAIKTVPVERLEKILESGKKLMKISFALPGARKFTKPNAMGSSGVSIEQVAKPLGFGRKGLPGTSKGGIS